MGETRIQYADSISTPTTMHNHKIAVVFVLEILNGNKDNLPIFSDWLQENLCDEQGLAISKKFREKKYSLQTFIDIFTKYGPAKWRSKVCKEFRKQTKIMHRRRKHLFKARKHFPLIRGHETMLLQSLLQDFLKDEQ